MIFIAVWPYIEQLPRAHRDSLICIFNSSVKIIFSELEKRSKHGVSVNHRLTNNKAISLEHQFVIILSLGCFWACFWLALGGGL